MKPILVTGVAGFIGFHLCQRLLAQGKTIVGIDNLNDYYDVNLKLARLAQLKNYPKFQFYKLDLSDRQGIADLFAKVQPDRVVNLAAQAGVRYSLTNPYAYIDSNLLGFTNILEGCRHHNVKHLVFASSSSVYGNNTKMPFSVEDNVDSPISLYAATKKANELMAHTYSYLYGLPTTGLRFFTVYGPWGRPDMALFIFTKAILAGKPIPVFNYGKMKRDFTYIDDIITGVVRTLDRIPGSSTESPVNSSSEQKPTPYKIYNIGNNHPVELLRFIEIIEDTLGKKAQKEFLPMQPGDVPATYADIEELEADVGFRPSTPLEVGIPQFLSWYRSYYQCES
jgi:UDP-glucuronate 4-epimerase